MANPAPISEPRRDPIRVLVADSAASVRECCLAVLRLAGFDVTACASGAEAVELVHSDHFDVVIVEERSQPVDGLAVLRTALAKNPDTRVIMTAAVPTTQASEQAIRSGAWDYLPKPFSATHLQLIVGMASYSEVGGPPSTSVASRVPLKLSTTRRAMITPIGRAPSFRSALELARRVAPTDIPVLLTGETGTGKEILANYIHQHSRRAGAPLVPINCSALPDALCESELFGHRKGAFTHAVRDKAGLLESAHGGTLFMDEVLDMPVATQAKLLRVMEDGVVRRVGSETPDAVVSVRFIAASNADPERAVHDGRLRQDFYYRLNVMRLHLPPLRERVDDIPLLANLFLTTYWRRNQPTAPLPTLSEAALQALKQHPWRGNLRELQNVIEWATVSAASNHEIGPEDLSLPTDQPRVGMERADDQLAGTLDDARDRFLGDFESRYLHWVIDRADGNVAGAARLAGVGRATLYRMMLRRGVRCTRSTTVPPRSLFSAAERNRRGPVLA